MNIKEIIGFCFEKGLLVDREVLSLFDETDTESTKLILEKVKTQTNQRIVTRKVLSKSFLKEFFSEFPEEEKKLETLKIKLGLSIEISKETERREERNQGFIGGSVRVTPFCPPANGKIKKISMITPYLFRN